MPFLIWLSAFSYWRRVNAEMAHVTLQFLDHVESPRSPQIKNAMVLSDHAGRSRDTKMCVLVGATCAAEMNFVTRAELMRRANPHRKA